MKTKIRNVIVVLVLVLLLSIVSLVGTVSAANCWGNTDESLCTSVGCNWVDDI